MKLFKSTPENCFEGIINYDYKTHYITDVLSDTNYKDFKIAYIDENKDGKKGTILCIHGHPTWSYMWRHIIPLAIQEDYRIIALDLPGFGKSDKLIEESFFSFYSYRNTIVNFVKKLNLKDITLFLHEWGGTLGLTLPMDNEKNYKGLVCFSSYIGNNLVKVSESYLNWINSNKENDDLNVRALMARTNRILNLSECNAYDAPFPDNSYKLALKMLPSIYPLNQEDKGFDICVKAENWWNETGLENSIVIGGGKDPIIPIDKMKLLSKIIASDGVTHVINNAGHFIPEWAMEFGPELFNQLQE